MHKIIEKRRPSTMMTRVPPPSLSPTMTTSPSSNRTKPKMMTMIAMMPRLQSFLVAFIALGGFTVLSQVSGFVPLLQHGKNRCADTQVLAAHGSRRDVLSSTIKAAGLLTAGSSLGVPRADADVTDATSQFSNTDRGSAYGFDAFVKETQPVQAPPQSTTAVSDEVSVRVAKNEITKGGLGIELGEVSFRTNTRVYVKSVLSDSLAERLGVKPNFVFVAINEQSVERTNAEGVGRYLADAVKKTGDDAYVTLTFRNPGTFQSKISDLEEGESVTTQIAPAGDTTQRREDGSVKFGRSVTEQEDQRLTVTQLIPPRMCNRQAAVDDLLEIAYLGTVVETGDVFDGSAVNINGNAIPGRANDVSLFFVLGKQPFGQFPPGWDVGVEGMCVGERRRIVVPPVLAYGSKGLPRRGIPPDATLQYDITLISINGLATP